MTAPSDGCPRRSIAVSLLGRSMLIMGGVMLIAPLFVPVQATTGLDEFQLRCLAMATAVIFCIIGYALERRMLAGFLLYIAGTSLSLLSHLAAMDAHNLGLAMIDAGFLALMVMHRREFHRDR